MASPRFRSLWISDVHLGFKECKAEFLLNFLQQCECERLYLVGDLIDFWSLRKACRRHRRFRDGRRGETA
ncbi:MAG: hypothetical protein WAV07_18630 [Candidatus Contendobacter sp.]